MSCVKRTRPAQVGLGCVGWARAAQQVGWLDGYLGRNLLHAPSCIPPRTFANRSCLLATMDALTFSYPELEQAPAAELKDDGAQAAHEDSRPRLNHVCTCTSIHKASWERAQAGMSHQGLGSPAQVNLPASTAMESQVAQWSKCHVPATGPSKAQARTRSD